MCFMKAPKPIKPPPPPQVSKLEGDALRDRQQRRASTGGTILSATNITKGLAGSAPTAAVSAGGRTIMG